MDSEITHLHSSFQHPLSSRYSSKEMQTLFSDDFKYALWRQLWFNLAKAQYNAGISCPGLNIFIIR